MSGYKKTSNGFTNRDFTFENPYDLAPVYAAYAQAIEKGIAERKPGQPLIILSGERHGSTPHVMNHIGGLSHLLKMKQENPNDPTRNFFYAREAEFNLPVRISRYYDISVPAYLEHYPEKIDPDNLISIDALISYTDKNSHVADNMHWRFIKKHSITTIFNDAARFYSEEKKGILCRRDPLFKQALEIYIKMNFEDDHDISAQLQKLSSQDVSLEDKISLALRNIMMVGRAFKKMRETETSIVFQHCGNAHVFGMSRREQIGQFQYSLANLYRLAGAYVLPIVQDSSSVGSVPLKEFPNTFLPHGKQPERVNATYLRETHIPRLIQSYGENNCPFAPENLYPQSEISKENFTEALQRNIQQNKMPNFIKPLVIS